MFYSDLNQQEDSFKYNESAYSNYKKYYHYKEELIRYLSVDEDEKQKKTMRDYEILKRVVIINQIIEHIKNKEPEASKKIYNIKYEEIKKYEISKGI